MKKWMIAVMVIAALGYAITPSIADLEPCAKIVGDEATYGQGVPYLGYSRGPGDQVGMTWYDFQANGSYNQRIDIDDDGQAHIDWMWRDAGNTVRYCAWNFRYDDGSYYGETPASLSWSGYVGIDITRDAAVVDQRTVVCYHYNPGAGYYGWVDIDGGNGWGTWPNTPRTPGVADDIWPYIAVANNGNFIMVTGDYTTGENNHHGYLSTDEGVNWTSIFDDDSCACLSQYVRASENSGSAKVVIVNTSFITDSAASGQLDNDVYYRLSTDNGASWGARTNLTNYTPADSIRAYCNVHALFDNSDNLHIFWAGRRVTDNYYDASNIYHWDEVSGTVTKVNSPSTYYTNDWWITVTGAGDFGGWRMPADQPQACIRPNGDIICYWHGNDDYNDFAADGYINGEIYRAYSTDNGATWSDYVNMTNTRSPGAAAGNCDDEDYFTVAPKTFDFGSGEQVFLTYIEDKDAGAYPQTEGVETENPVRCWVHPVPGIEENNSTVPINTALSLYPNPAVNTSSVSYALTRSGNMSLSLFDVTGRLVNEIESGSKVAGTYDFDLDVRSLANGTYFVVLDTPTDKVSHSLVIMH
jgi:hypothetical protein